MPKLLGVEHDGVPIIRDGDRCKMTKGGVWVRRPGTQWVLWRMPWRLKP